MLVVNHPYVCLLWHYIDIFISTFLIIILGQCVARPSFCQSVCQSVRPTANVQRHFDETWQTTTSELFYWKAKVKFLLQRANCCTEGEK